MIASTASGYVYLAESVTGERVALKELVFRLAPDRAALECFEREAKLLAQLDHPAVPRLVASFVEGAGVDTRCYLAQEFVEGESLLQELNRTGAFSEERVSGVAREVLEVLHYLHGLSPCIVHRDIKPANVIRRRDGRLALVDFGTAREIRAGGTFGSTLVGTIGYTAPELLGGTVDARSDLYSLGATLLHLRTGHAPETMLSDGMHIALPPGVALTDKLRSLVLRLVEPRPDDRFTSAAEALLALDSPSGTIREQRRRWPWAVSAVGAVAALAGLVVLAWPGARPAAPARAGVVGSPAAAATPPALATPAKAPLDPDWRERGRPKVKELVFAEPPLNLAPDAAIVRKKLRARWRLDDENPLTAKTTLKEETGHYPAAARSVEHVRGVRAGAMRATGPSSGLVLGDGVLAGLAGASMTFWLRPDSRFEGGVFWSGHAARPDTRAHGCAQVDPGVKGTELSLAWGPDNTLVFSDSEGTLLHSRPLAKGEFHFVAINWAPALRQLMVDGALQSKMGVPLPMAPCDAEFEFVTGGDRHWLRTGPATLDDVRIWEEPLELDEVLALRAEGAGVPGTWGGPPREQVLMDERFTERSEGGSSNGMDQRPHPPVIVSAGAEGKPGLRLVRTGAMAGDLWGASYSIPLHGELPPGTRLRVEYDLLAEEPAPEDEGGVELQVVVQDDRNSSTISISGQTKIVLVLAHGQPGHQGLPSQPLPPLEKGRWARNQVIELDKAMALQGFGALTAIEGIHLGAYGRNFDYRFENLRIVAH